VAVSQRIDQAGYKILIDERVLSDTDTWMVFGLDHLVSEQEAEQEEIDAIRRWLNREGTCLLLAPHHDVGFTSDMEQRQTEYKHHGDELVPRQQRFGQCTRSLMKGLDVPVLNQFGLRPAVVEGTKQIAPLKINRDLDKVGLLDGVTVFNFHLDLPHYALTTEDTESIADSTIFTTLFGGTESLELSWRNMAKLRQRSPVTHLAGPEHAARVRGVRQSVPGESPTRTGVPACTAQEGRGGDGDELAE
jgi:hypothetical protein